MHRRLLACGLALVLSTWTSAAWQQQQAPAQRLTSNDSQFDQAAVERGRELLVAQCGFCHGSNARGGAGGPDLTRSALVQDDEGGKQLGEFLRAGRPDRGMPAFQLTAEQTTDLATFLHAALHLNANRRLYQILDILTGDPKAGEAYFNGAGKCSSCHSIAGDLKGVGSKYDPVALQQRFLMPRGGRGAGPPVPAHLEKNAIKATVVIPSRETVTGTLVRMTDFDILLYDPASGQMRSWFRNGDTPKITIVDPLQGHIDLWSKWTDDDMHNMTAYLASLK